MAFIFDMEENAEKLLDFEDFIASHGKTRGDLMNVLHHGQSVFGYLPLEVQELVSKKMNIPLSDIYGVITFYSQFSTIPKGKHEIGVCMGTACYVRGAQKILDEVQNQLQIEVGQTTKDMLFSIQATRCVGACGLAPVMMIDDDVYGKLNANEVKEILNKYKERGESDES